MANATLRERQAQYKSCLFWAGEDRIWKTSLQTAPLPLPSPLLRGEGKGKTLILERL